VTHANGRNEMAAFAIAIVTLMIVVAVGNVIASTMMVKGRK